MLWRLALSSVFAVGLAACVEEPVSDGTCTPGEVISCPCLGGGQSTQMCSEDGLMYGPCDCVGVTTMPPDTGDEDDGGLDTGVDTTGEDCGENPSLQDCDVWDPDCPEGERCGLMGEHLEMHVCIGEACNPQPVGAPCQAEEGIMAGIDDCEAGSVCWNADVSLYEGICVELCTGSLGNPTCETEGFSCILLQSGANTTALCTPDCDPLLQDCSSMFFPQHQCGPNGEDDPFTFNCLPDYSYNMADEGAACSFNNVCNAGLFCHHEMSVGDCENSEDHCCTPFCDLTGPNDCPGAGFGEECVDMWMAANAPDVGGCAIP